MATTRVIAIFDVGKTNKKVFLFDEQYQIVYERSVKFSETLDEDADACEDLEQLTAWVRQSLKSLLQLKEFAIRALNFSAYGASLVHIGESGKAILPLYSYLKPYPKNLKRQFFDDYGGEKHLSGVTASPVLDSLNSGLQLYRLKYEKNLGQLRGYSLHLPQYLSFLVTGRAYSDITSVGCHTMLWDFTRNAYHDWVYREKLIDRLAPIFPSDQVLHATAETLSNFGTGRAPAGDQLDVGIGLHDSSAALIPYLSSFHQPFILISTGTWCISLNPFNDLPLTEEELEQDCLCFMTYKGKRVKASRLFAGFEHECQVKKLAEHFGKPPEYYESVEYDYNLVAYLQAHTVQDQREQLTPGASMFAQRELGLFRSYEEAYHQLIMDIMRQQMISTRLIMKGTPVRRLFVDGGFGRNPVYMNLLSLAFATIEIYAASVAQATAIGAALAIHPHWNPEPVPADLIALKFYASPRNG